MGYSSKDMTDTCDWGWREVIIGALDHVWTWTLSWPRRYVSGKIAFILIEFSKKKKGEKIDSVSNVPCNQLPTKDTSIKCIRNILQKHQEHSIFNSYDIKKKKKADFIASKGGAKIYPRNKNGIKPLPNVTRTIRQITRNSWMDKRPALENRNVLPFYQRSTFLANARRTQQQKQR